MSRRLKGTSGVGPTMSDHVDSIKGNTHGRDSASAAHTRWRAAKGRVFEYLNTEHDYALISGDSDSGERKTMTGKEALNENGLLEQEFMASVSGKRMRRWILVENLDSLKRVRGLRYKRAPKFGETMPRLFK